MYSLVPRAAHAASGPSRQTPLTTSGEGHSMSFIPITKLSVMTLDWEAGRMYHSWRGQRAQAAGNGDTVYPNTQTREGRRRHQTCAMFRIFYCNDFAFFF